MGKRKEEMMGTARLEAELKELRRDNDDLKRYILALQGEVYGARLAAKYLDKELAGRCVSVCVVCVNACVWSSSHSSSLTNSVSLELFQSHPCTSVGFPELLESICIISHVSVSLTRWCHCSCF